LSSNKLELRVKHDVQRIKNKKTNYEKNFRSYLFYINNAFTLKYAKPDYQTNEVVQLNGSKHIR